MNKENILLPILLGLMLGLAIQGLYDSFKYSDKKETVLVKNIREFEEKFKKRDSEFDVETHEPDSIGIYYPEKNCILILK